MGILSTVKGVLRPLKKVLPSKATLTSFATKLKPSNVSQKLGKIGSIFSTKGGKIGLGVVAGLGLAAGIAYLLANNKETDANKSKLEEKIAELTGSKPKNDNSTVNNVPEEKPDATRVEKPVIVNTSDESDKTPELKDENQANKPAENNKEEENSAVAEEKEEAPKQAEKAYHDVKAGDNVWNIAKKHLKDIHKDDESYRPSNNEIAKHTKELMEINNLKYEKDNYRVIINPGDKIQLVA